MKKQFLTLMFGATLLATVAMAAGPDFNGAWLRDSANSDPAPSAMWLTMNGGPGGPGGGGRGGGRGFGPAQVIMTVHQDAKIVHVELQGVTHEYELDGNPHTKTTDTGIQKAEITANLQGDTLVIGTSQPYGGMPGNATLNIKEVWSLSPDGNTLTITTTRDVPARRETFKQVYTRTQAQAGAICSAGCIAPAPAPAAH